MRVLIIQENGRHAKNRAFRECYGLWWAFAALGHDPVVWGQGHANFHEPPAFNDFELILNLENYDDMGWLPDLSKYQAPTKMLWAVDEHVQDIKYYERLFKRDDCRFWLHATRDFVKDPAVDIWFPNALDPSLVRPRQVALRADVGFCGNVINRRPWLDLLKQHFSLAEDIFIIGADMVRAINSYKVAFNRNIANDINGRSFEVIGCGVPLITNFNPQYPDLGFRHRENCVFYQTEQELLEGVRWLLEDDARRQSVAHAGFELSRQHTYLERAKFLLHLFEHGSKDVVKSSCTIVQPVLPQPKVSICVLTDSGLSKRAARQVFLKNLLRSVALAGFDEPPEIIVAGAVPPLEGARVLQHPDLAAAGEICKLRNLAVAASHGTFIIQCDDDILFTPGYWPAIVEQLGQPWEILCTRLLNPNGTRYWDWAAHYPGKGLTLLPYEVHDPYAYATGGHAVYRRQVFEKIHWNETYRHGQNEEFDLAQQARDAGLRFGFCTEATVFLQYHHCDAAAVITRQPQRAEVPVCQEFAHVTSRIAGSPATPKLTVVSRIAHKVSGGVKPPKVSILVACNRYLQRFRVFAQSIIRQNYDLQQVEVVVANPHSPDGLSNFMKVLKSATAESGPDFKEVLADETFYRNRGYLVQRAFEASSGEVILGMDCDLILPPNFLATLAPLVADDARHVFGVYRRFLTPRTTDRILAGQLDPHTDLQSLLQEDQQEEQGYRGVLGYCQAVRRELWEKMGYPEEFDNIARSDVAFVERLAQHGIQPHFLQDLAVLHLHHERDWEGTKSFL